MRIPQGAARWRQYAAPRRVDLLIAGGLLIWGLPDVPWWWEHPGHRDSIPAILAALALTLVMSVPFCWRRRFPFLVLAAAASVLDGEEAVRLAREAQPDVVLMDVRMPRLDGLAATRRIACEQPPRQTSHPARVVILTTYDLDEYVYEALRAGACGFLLKHAPPEELLLGVRAAADGGALLSPAVTKRLLAEFAARRPSVPAPAALSGLTSREREVLGLVVLGWSNAEIAAQLVVTQSTVKTHVGHILDKLDLRDRVHAVVFGYEHGLAGPAQAYRPPQG